ncbi:hypothetical protein CERSUDRAFT_139739 [Gelatoporia subvermispora B]|uniref:Oxidase ustYa n=1 Tax=Ceriporiopsis subvermispora (strain B) TaxID=914234 RepID=M2R971_CERS8|nr:hypothetical protein CERSUDRAFT_139739 [Gelatoporia subvermispora B]
MVSFKTFALVALFSCCLNLTYVWWTFKVRDAYRRASRPFSYRGHDFPEALPLPEGDLSLVTMTVEESTHYPLLGLASDSEWFSLTPQETGYGYARLGPDHRMFVVTMFHELHCLRILNLAFGKVTGATTEHIRHCLSYIRQGVLCSPDLTLEPGNFEERDFKTERIGATHTCRDWEAAYSVMYHNHDQWETVVHGSDTDIHSGTMHGDENDVTEMSA